MTRLGSAYALALLIGALLFYEGYVEIRPAMHAAGVSGAAILLYLACLKASHRPAMAGRALAIVVSLPALAWSLSNLWVLFLVVGILVPLIARDRQHVVPVYLFSLLLLPALDTPTLIGPLKLFDLSVHDALAIGTTVAVMRDTSRKRPPRQFDVAAIAVVLLLAAAIARGTSASHFIRESCNIVIDLGLPYYIVSRGLATIEDIRRAMLWLGAGGTVLSAILIYEVSKNWVIYNELYRIYELPTTLYVKARNGHLRAGGPFNEPTSVAMVLGQCVFALWLCRDFFRSKGHYLTLVMFGLYGLSMPQSRGALIGFCIALAAADLFRGRYAQLWVKVAAVAAVVFFALATVQVWPELALRLGLAGDAGDTSTYRRILLERGMQEFWKSPWIGFSTPQLFKQMVDLKQGEGIVDLVNAYLWIALISGIGGLAIFVSTFFHFLSGLWNTYRSGPRTAGNQDAATFVFATLVMVMEMLFFTSFGTRPAIFVFVLFGMGAAYVGTCRRSRQAEETLAPTSPPQPLPA